MVSFMPLPLYPPGRHPGTHYIEGWVGPGPGPDIVQKRKVSCSCWESNPDSLVVQPTACLVTILIELSQLQLLNIQVGSVCIAFLLLNYLENYKMWGEKCIEYKMYIF
jgi:hypothetical protein